MFNPLEVIRTKFWSGRRLQKALSQIQLVETGLAKARFGEAHDGGYVLIDEKDPLAGLLSFGVGETIHFEKDLAEAWVLPVVLLADPTVEKPRDLPPQFQFFSTGLKGLSKLKAESLQDWVQRLPDQEPRRWILKIDVEGDEWVALDEVPESFLRAFRQIVIEFHHWDRDWDRVRRVYEKLHRQFDLVHAHANNYGGLIQIGSIRLPEVMELTWSARDCVRSKAIKIQNHQAMLDFPNDPNRAELPRDHWPFTL